MFRKWLREHDISGISFDSRLFPKASDRAFWEKYLGAKEIAEAENYLGYEWPLMRATQFMEFQKSGDRLAQEKPHFARRTALLSLFLGELAEHKGRFLPDICDGIFLICEETYWGLSAHFPITRTDDLLPSASDPYIDLFAAETGELLAVVFHILGEELRKFCPPLCERVEYELDRRIVVPYLTHGDFWWMGNLSKKVNNWNPWILACVLTVFLTGGLRRSVFERGMEKMLREINVYYDTMPADGGCDEGSNYWTKAGAKLFTFCDRLYIATDGTVNFFHDEKLRNIGLYETKAYMDGCCFVNFSDGNSFMGKTNLDYELYAYGKRTGAENLCRLAGTFRRERLKLDPDAPSAVRGSSIFSVLMARILIPEIEAEPPFVPEEVSVLPDIENAFVRAGKWYYAAKGGHNEEQHNHNDVGSLIVRHGTEPVLIDAGCGTYTRFTFSKERYTIWTMQSGWHNLPAVNGCDQLPGEAYRAGSFTVDGKETEISFAGAYPAEAALESLVRQIGIGEESVTVSDSFTFTAGQNHISEHFISLEKPEVTGDGVLLGGKYLLQVNIPCEASIDQVCFPDDPKLCGAWGTDHLWRVRMDFDCKDRTEFTLKILRAAEKEKP